MNLNAQSPRFCNHLVKSSSKFMKRKFYENSKFFSINCLKFQWELLLWSVCRSGIIALSWLKILMR